MIGKKKCRLLKEIRQKIADENDIPYVTSECTYKGECAGTCPKCEAELRYLEQELENRRKVGKRVAVAAVAAGLTLSMTGCREIKELFKSNETTGVMPAVKENRVEKGDRAPQFAGLGAFSDAQADD